MDFHVHIEGRGELASQIYRQLRAAIVDGRLAHGDRLPPTRELAQRLDVSRNTVSLAYEWLVADGLLAGRKGAGSFVESPVAHAKPRRGGTAIRQREVWSTVHAPAERPSARFDFGVGAPDARLFPFDIWRRLVSRTIRASLLRPGYGDAAGHPRLRAAIAHHIGVARGVHAEADDVLITNGAQQAFDLLARVLLEAGTRVAVEDPGYPPARLAFLAAGARIVGVRVDEEGLVVDALPDDARLVYVTPSHQFPLGMPMSHARRVALLAWAERRNAVLVEDDYDSEFRFGGRPLETLQAIDRAGRVAYVGSFSKVLLPSLRLGFLVAPPALRESLRAASYVTGWDKPWPEQAALASLIESGLLARHIRKMRREYSARHEHILRTLACDFAPWLRPIESVTGLHLCAPFRRSSLRAEQQLAARAEAAGVAFDRLSTYGIAKPPRTGIVLGYGGIALRDIDEGLKRLRACFARGGASRTE